MDYIKEKLNELQELIDGDNKYSEEIENFLKWKIDRMDYGMDDYEIEHLHNFLIEDSDNQ